MSLGGESIGESGAPAQSWLTRAAVESGGGANQIMVASAIRHQGHKSPTRRADVATIGMRNLTTNLLGLLEVIYQEDSHAASLTFASEESEILPSKPTRRQT